jgi:photosystem II stability/assembly factor-like uncharacterized protein
MILRRHFVFAGLAVSCGASKASFKDSLNFAAVAVKSPERHSLLSVAMAGQRIVAVGMRGLIVVSDDEGRNWRQIPLSLSSDLVSVIFVSSQRGWACGHDGVVLQTVDGGITWTPQLKGMDFANILIKHYEKAADAGRAGAQDMVRTIKMSFAAGSEQPVLGVWFIDESTGWAVSTFGMILGTTDGGKTWLPWIDQVDNPDQLHFYSICGVAGSVYITSERGKVFKLDRSRNRFVALNTGYPGGLFGLVGNAGVLLAFGMQGTALRSRDGGVSWQRRSTGLRAGLNAGVVLPGNRIFVVSQDGQLLVSGDQGLSFKATSVPSPGLLTGIVAASPSKLIVVGFNGVQIVNA